MRRFFPPYVYNPITFFGAGLAGLSFGLILFLTILEFLSPETKPYMGIITFIILPIFLLIGVFLLVFGMLRERRRLEKGILRKKRFVIIDFNDPKQRRMIFTFSTGAVLLLFFSAFGSYKAYEFSDSDEFCGEMCHEVMEPEYTAYLSSPHSRVGCVTCHIGSGAAWFVRAKISGAYQVYSVLFNKYSKPIPTPVHDLRPAEGTCEQCHSPEHFFSEIKYEATYYLYDEQNTKSSIAMFLKIGGGNERLGRREGIHWHMNIANKIEYISTDSIRNEIPWVRLTRSDGTEKIYKKKNFTYDEKRLSTNNIRTMDCIDCHNRPSHIYHPSDKSVNLSMSLGRIDESLPYIKSIAVNALEENYSTKTNGLDSIAYLVTDFYHKNYPSIAEEKAENISQAVDEIQKIYDRNFFPSMKVSWRGFPNHISHLYDSGCFRCHDGEHFTDDGEMIRKDCNLCHTIISQKTSDGRQLVSMNGIDFVHPEYLGTDLKDLNCVECHARK
ncbi:MAG TPA: NapC/NirT family cytochrome c [Ignavibacteriaceae bacterium]|nr:NapC/NirT family cytochrome c [Ignavibacteriaceae bacterium]